MPARQRHSRPWPSSVQNIIFSSFVSHENMFLAFFNPGATLSPLANAKCGEEVYVPAQLRHQAARCESDDDPGKMPCLLQTSAPPHSDSMPTFVRCQECFHEACLEDHNKPYPDIEFSPAEERDGRVLYLPGFKPLVIRHEPSRGLPYASLCKYFANGHHALKAHQVRAAQNGAWCFY